VCERLVEWVLDVLLSIVAHSYAFLCYSTVPAIAARLLGQCCLISSSNYPALPHLNQTFAFPHHRHPNESTTEPRPATSHIDIAQPSTSFSLLPHLSPNKHRWETHPLQTSVQHRPQL
jgi:hypothetical protein